MSIRFIVRNEGDCPTMHKMAHQSSFYGTEFDFQELKYFVRDEADDDEFVINWGVSKCRRKQFVRLNRSLVTNKNRALDILSDNNIKVPLMYAESLSKAEINRICTYPILGRKEQHTQGKDIVVINNYDELRACNRPYFFVYINKASEWRVHVLGGEVKILSQKRFQGEGDKPIVWSNDNGFRFINRVSHDEADDILFYKLREIAIKSVEALRYDFGAVDMALDEDDNIYVLEVNSSPALNRNRRRVYIKYFIKEANDG